MAASSKGSKMSDSVVIRLDNYTKALKTDRLQRRVQRHMRPVRKEGGSTARPGEKP
jgi:hypothetical protein